MLYCVKWALTKSSFVHRIVQRDLVLYRTTPVHTFPSCINKDLKRALYCVKEALKKPYCATKGPWFAESRLYLATWCHTWALLCNKRAVYCATKEACIVQQKSRVLFDKQALYCIKWTLQPCSPISIEHTNKRGMSRVWQNFVLTRSKNAISNRENCDIPKVIFYTMAGKSTPPRPFVARLEFVSWCMYIDVCNWVYVHIYILPLFPLVV